MDPYLEAHWQDVHSKLVTYASDAMNARLPDDLVASTEERVAVESDESFQSRFHPDVRVFEPSSGGGGATVMELPEQAIASAPVRLVLEEELATEGSIRIIESGTERLITVIEFVSPSNKKNPGMGEFRGKRSQLVAAGVNFIEVDLVRDGDWKALLGPHRCPEKWLTPYRVTVRSPREPGEVGMYPISLRDALPSIVIPLREKDPEVRLELQPLIEQAYANGRYARRLNYAVPPVPPLDTEDGAWALQRLQSLSKNS